MKRIERIIQGYEEDLFFKPIRTKIDYIRVLLLTIRKILLKDFVSETYKYTVRVIIDKSSRVYYYHEDKYFSMSFPFSYVENKDGSIEIRCTSRNILINNKIISELLRVINNPLVSENMSLIDYIIESNGDDVVSQNTIDVIEYMLFIEPSYIRFDYDPKNHNGDIHPLYHLDINYSALGTYKLGLQKCIDQSFFEDLQNIQTACKYLNH